MNYRTVGAVSGLLMVCLVVSCERLQERMEITETREISQFESQPKLFAYSQERFGDERLRWETPAGWNPAERTQMRPLNFTFGPANEGECYLSMMPGGGGSVLDNVNRWRKQMGLPPASEEDIGKLPRKRLMGIEGVFVSLDGDFSGVGMTEARKGYRMLGVIAMLGEAGLFVKMVGPRDQVEKQTESFDRFVASLSLRMPSGAQP